MTIKIVFVINVKRLEMIQYLDLLKNVFDNGIIKKDRTGIGTKSIFGWQMRFNLRKGFPLLTTKKLHIKSIIYELLWFVKGDTNIKYLNENNVHIWDDWANDKGDLGPVYGKQWRSWENNGVKIDQLKNAIELIKSDPSSRRIIVSSWNPVDVSRMALPPCHCLFQFNVIDGKLSCQLYQRSADIFLGVPFNIASYALLTHMIADLTNLDVGFFVHTLGDAHLYLNHQDQAKEQLARKPRDLPTLVINKKRKSIDEFEFDDFTFENYAPDPHIKAPIAV